MAKARELLGTLPNGRPRVRWRHQGRDPATGIDCAGAVVWVAHGLGHKVDVDFRAYERYPSARQLRAVLDRELHRRPLGMAEAEPGDVLLLADLTTRWPLHVAFLVPPRPVRPGEQPRRRVLHSWSRARGVVEMDLPSEWAFKVSGVYCYRPLVGLEG